MESYKVHVVVVMVGLVLLFPITYGWGIHGHATVCAIAQARLSEAATQAVNKLLPKAAENNLSSYCSWADRVKFRYHWTSPLHYINTPDNLCTYQYKRDCKDEAGVADRCVAGAINNYTTQLLTYNTEASRSASKYNLTEALLFLAHYMGDIHQPLHVGFTSDKGANTINVKWYRRKANLHHVWDVSIIETAEKQFYDSDMTELVDAIQKKIKSDWKSDVTQWETCGRNMTTCPDIYASEGIKAACDWAYKGVEDGSVLEDKYFESRLPIVYQHLAQGGVRLAATLNRIFG